MSAVAAPRPRQIGDNERLSATLVLSLLLHGMLVLGVGFALDDAAPVLPTLDVILTQTQTAADAQAGRLPRPGQQPGRRRTRQEHAPARHARSASRRKPEPGVAPRDAARAVARAAAAAGSARDQQRCAATPRAPPQETPTPQDDRRYPEAARRSSATWRWRAWPRRSTCARERYAKRPKRKFVSASTQEYAYAGYLRSWVDRVERVGNLNYPDEARRRHIGGLLVISVAIRRDGSIERADIIQSSHIPMLDAAALRIVRLSEPFAPLPKTPENVDILHVMRTWQFMPGGELIDR